MSTAYLLTFFPRFKCASWFRNSWVSETAQNRMLCHYYQW